MTRIVPAFRRMADIRERIIADAGGRPVDPMLWEYLSAAHLELLTASILEHIDRCESIDKARKARQ